MTEFAAAAKPLRPTLTIQPAAPAPPPTATAPARKPPPVTGPWRPRTLLASPHRLGFFLAMLVLVVASLWWLVVQGLIGGWGLLVQMGGAQGWLKEVGSAVMPINLVHGAVMVFGFIPLFFSGFLFTAGPRWLNVPPLAAARLLPPLGLQVVGWLLWLVGAQLGLGVSEIGLALACVGLGWMYAKFWRLIAASPLPDRVHAMVAGVGGLIGVLCLAGIGIALWANQLMLALTLVHMALWGFIAITFMAVAHRMIPFFTSGVLPMIQIWRPFWVLWLMLSVAAFEALAVWLDLAPPPGSGWPVWTVVAALVEAAVGGVLLWLAVVWGLVQSLKIRLLAMLHVGFVWLGLALLYSALARVLGLAAGQALLGLGPLHALSMGFLGSIMMAMVTRVSCGHSGRSLVADNLVWALFWLLQVAVVVRLLAAAQGTPPWLTALAALLWTATIAAWALRYGNWYGRPRVDGKPG